MGLQAYGYNGMYPGPTFEAIVNRPVEVIWRNQLPEQHILPTEPLFHGTSAHSLHERGG